MQISARDLLRQAEEGMLPRGRGLRPVREIRVSPAGWRRHQGAQEDRRKRPFLKKGQKSRLTAQQNH